MELILEPAKFNHKAFRQIPLIMPSDEKYDFSKSSRVILCEDSVKHLRSKRGLKAIITSLPDAEEVDLDIAKWTIWIKETCLTIMDSLADDGIVFFYQTNRKHKGAIIDKEFIISSEFFNKGYRKVISKVALKQAPDTINLFRPSYTNLFAFSKKLNSGKATPDVFYAGKMLYKDAMGFNAAEMCVGYVVKHVDTDFIIDPFCGRGSVLKFANDMGLNALGIDIIESQCKAAKKI